MLILLIISFIDVIAFAVVLVIVLVQNNRLKKRVGKVEQKLDNTMKAQ